MVECSLLTEVVMKKIYSALTLGCTYAVLTISVFYLFAVISGGQAPVLPPQRFFLLTAFGLLLSFINLGASVVKLNTVARESVRYLAILLSFILTVLLSKSENMRAATVIALSALFTLFYVVIFLISFLVKRAKSPTAQQAKKKANPASEKAKKPYKPLYGNTDEN